MNDELLLIVFGVACSRGFQKQNVNGNKEYVDPYTICGLLEIALKGCGALNYPKVTGSSRTDAGVHALCNTVHVDLEGDRQINSFNIIKTLNKFFSYNDHDIRVLKVQQVAEDFHCRHNACERKYLYRLAFPKPNIPYREKSVIPYPITEFNRCYFLQDHHFDAEAVKSACSLFLGVKDFASLCSRSRNILQQPDTVRELYSLELTPGRPALPFDSLTEEYHFWDITCRGRSFLYHQVRRIVSSLLAFGQGRVTIEDLQQLFDQPGDESWRRIGSMAPPEGLFLVDVQYKAEDLAFSEEQYAEEIENQQLREEMHLIVQKLATPEIPILKKIDLRKRLLEIKKLTGIYK